MSTHDLNQPHAQARRKLILTRPGRVCSRGFEEKVLSLKGRDWQKLDAVARERLVEECFRYWRGRGFPYYRMSNDEMLNEYGRLEAVTISRILLGREVQMSMVGMKLANLFHQQMWSVSAGSRRSPLDCFGDDRALRDVIRKALNIWPDRRSVNESNLRRMLKTYSHTAGVSNFRPTAAKAIYERYSGEGDDVLDFSAGYGGRLLGCLPLDRHYVGIDPCREQVRGLRAMLSKLSRLATLRVRADLHRACAEEFMPQLAAGSFALVFSSPPYFDHERYSDEPSQSYLKFPDYESWLASFLGVVVFESWRVLRPGGHLVVNVADAGGRSISRDTLRLARPYFKLVRTLKLRLGHIPYLRGHAGDAYKYEPVFVFRKERD